MKKVVWILWLVAAQIGVNPASVGASGPPIGTFSIVAYDSTTGEIGVAVQSRAFNVGAGVAWARAGVGGIATQSYTNESFGPWGLDLLAGGLSAQSALDSLLNGDEGRARRQVGIVDMNGKSASFTGEECMNWAGGKTGYGIAAQGNILAGKDVVGNMYRVFRKAKGELSVRLITALKAAQEAGGDKRGQQSAALLVVRPSAEYPEYEQRYVSLRVDDHRRPIDELERLYRIHEATDLAEAHIRYAKTYEEQGLDTKAEREMERLGETLQRVLNDPNASVTALNGMAWYTCTNDVYLDEALAAAQRALIMEPKSVEVLDTLAECHFRRGETAEAIQTIDKALSFEPDDDYLVSQKRRFESASSETE